MGSLKWDQVPRWQTFLSCIRFTLCESFAWQTFASIVYLACFIRTYCVLIPTLNQIKPFRLHYLVHTQILRLHTVLLKLLITMAFCLIKAPFVSQFNIAYKHSDDFLSLYSSHCDCRSSSMPLSALPFIQDSSFGIFLSLSLPNLKTPSSLTTRRM